MSCNLGVAIIGCGYWGVNYVRVFHELPDVRVVAVCDASPQRLNAVRARYPDVVATSEIEQALHVDGVDAAIVCTGATTHHDVVRWCLEAKKHVLVEKPMATNSADAENLIQLAASQGVTLMVGHTFLFNPGIAKVKEMIDRGDLGQLYYLYSRRTNMGPIRDDVNAIWDLAPHDVSIFNYLLNRQPQWVSAVGIRALWNWREDGGFISLDYGDSVVGNIHISWADPNKVRELVVVGSEKRIAFDDVEIVERVKVFEKGVSSSPAEPSSYGEYHFQIRDGDIFSPRLEVSEPLKNQCLHFLGCIADRTQPLTDGQAGLDVVRVMEAIDRSVELRGTPVDVATETTTTGPMPSPETSWRQA